MLTQRSPRSTPTTHDLIAEYLRQGGKIIQCPARFAVASRQTRAH